jgi:hypothetical protein
MRIKIEMFARNFMLAAMIASSPAAAGTVTYGTLEGSYGCQPFGCPTAVLSNGGGTSLLSWPTEYQQVYASPLTGMVLRPGRYILSQECPFLSRE